MNHHYYDEACICKRCGADAMSSEKCPILPDVIEFKERLKNTVAEYEATIKAAHDKAERAMTELGNLAHQANLSTSDLLSLAMFSVDMIQEIETERKKYARKGR